MKAKRAFFSFKGDRKFQINFYAYLLGLTLLTGLSVMLININLYMHSTRDLMGFIERNNEFFGRLISYSIFTLVVIMGMAFLVAMMSIRRVVGPMIRFQRVVKDLAEGRLDEPVRIRQGDEFEEMAKALEELRLKLQEKTNS